MTGGGDSLQYATLPSVTVARVAAIDIAVHWRWWVVLALGTSLLAGPVLPARFPSWDEPTLWLTSVAVVLAGELMLLLHELSHALVARGRGQTVQRIIFHGMLAETVLGEGVPTPRHDAVIALVGPATNLVLAALAQTLRVTFEPTGPLGVLMLLLMLANLAMAATSLVPVGASDGGRVLRAWRRSRAG